MTHVLILFFATFSAAFMATVPPGLLNMNAAKVSVEKGKLNGIIFSLGVSSTIMVQAYIAVYISKFLYRNPEVIDVLFKIAVAVFAFFAVSSPLRSCNAEPRICAHTVFGDALAFVVHDAEVELRLLVALLGRLE